MDNLTSSLNYICAFCTTKTTDNKAAGFLQAFNREFIYNPLFQLNLLKDNYPPIDNGKDNPDNWSICDNCLPQVQLLLQSKQKVDKVDSEVRYLQKRLLTEMKCLSKEVDQMCGEMVMLEGILRGNPVTPTPSTRIPVKKKKRGRPPSSKLTNEDTIMVQFRQKIFNVLQDLQTFRVETSNKLLLKNLSSCNLFNPTPPPPKRLPSPPPSPSKDDPSPVPNVKTETDDIDMDPSENYYSSPPTSPPQSLSPLPPPEMSPSPTDNTNDPDDGGGRPIKRIRKSKSLYISKPTEYEGLHLSSSSDEEIPEDFEDFEFDPSQRTSVKPNKTISKYSQFRKDIIARVREQSTISTSPHLPSSKDDPRRSYFIKYYSVTNTFSLNDIQFNLLDTLKTLQCSQCSYTTNYRGDNKGYTHKERNIEDWIFDHILYKHLNAYDCKLCGMSCRSWYKLTEHLRSHDNEFSCDICERPLASRKGLLHHKWTHLSEEEKKMGEYQDWKPFEARVGDVPPSFQCETCGKGFKRGRSLREHERIHEDKELRDRDKVMCPDCGTQVFQRNLTVHQRKYCERVRAPKKELDCKVCGENLRTWRELHEHLRERHPGEKVWGCEVCGGRFKTKWRMREHQLLHRVEKRWMCGRCGRGFKQKKSCKRHEGTCKA